MPDCFMVVFGFDSYEMLVDRLLAAPVFLAVRPGPCSPPRARLDIIISVLSYLGAIGFIVVHDLWRSLRHFKPSITLTSKVILTSTLWITVVGTVLFAIDEPLVKTLPVVQRWMASLFQVMTASTTVGFNTLPIGSQSALQEDVAL